MNNSKDDFVRKHAEELTETASLLKAIPGGPELLEWFGGPPEFGDGEIVSLVLDRRSSGRLDIKLERHGKAALISFQLKAWIDVALRGFSHQNVIGGLRLPLAGDRKIEKWELGVGIEPGALTIELEPCFGGYGSIRADISSVTFNSI